MSEALSYTEEDKKIILRTLKEQRENNLILHKPILIRLMRYLGVRLETTPCDHTFRHTEEWLEQNTLSDMHDEVIQDFRSNGMMCDCEVVYSCYDKFFE
jgi:hypothetical protein